MRSSSFTAAALATFFTVSVSQYIDPNSVPLATRQHWCQDQISACPLICIQEAGNSAATYANDCDATTFVYNCVCSNGLSPNASEYSQTIPYYLCTETNTNCVAACGGDNTCASSCRQDHPCGAQNPTRVNTSTITTMPATSTTDEAAASTGTDGQVVYTGFGGAAETSAAASEESGSSNSAESSSASQSSGSGGSSAASRVIVNVGQMYGLGLVAAGIFAGFAFVL